MFRRLLLAGAMTLFATTSLAQMGGQQRQDDIGIMSTQQSGQQSSMNAQIQQVNPLQSSPVQSPTITNNPDFPRQPIFGPGMSSPFPGQSQTPGQLQTPGQRAVPGLTEQRARAPGSDRNEFQQLISTSTGQSLPLFGQNLFDAPSTFAPVDNIPVTPDYVIGPGDEILIRAWGQIDIDYRAPVDRNGMINVPRVGSIPVAGVRYQDLTGHIRSAVSRNFKNFELLVSMGQLRTIQIFVVGHARRPGAYTLSSLSTLVNAAWVYASNPSPARSKRRLRI
jgi:polysaccharide biosynthesis/export protein